MVVFAASRPIQVIWILGSLITVWEGLILWQVTFVFTVLQCYSLTIHYKLLRKCQCLFLQNERKKKQENLANKNADQEEEATRLNNIREVDHWMNPSSNKTFILENSEESSPTVGSGDAV